MSAPRVLAAGHVCVDLTPQLAAMPTTVPGDLSPIGPMRITPAGSVANTGLALVRLGIPVRGAGDIGDDGFGQILRDALAEGGMDLAGIRRTDLPTSYTIVVQPPGRDRTFWHHVGANAGFDGADLDLDGIDLLHVGYPDVLPALASDDAGPLADLFARARALGVTTSLDLNVVADPTDATRDRWRRLLDRVLPVTDVLSPSIDDLRTAVGTPIPPDADGLVAVARSLVDQGVGVVAVTAATGGIAIAAGTADRLAAGGRILAALGPEWAGAAHWEAAPVVEKLVTTTGAGDAATGGLLAGLLHARSPHGACALAGRTAAAVVGGVGVTPALLA